MSKSFSGNAGLVKRTAVISPDGLYRYRLGRSWPSPNPRLPRYRVAFCMLNPSTGDAFVDDATIRKCMVYAQRWGYADLDIVNLFAWRSRDPMKLRTVPDPIGPENFHHIGDALTIADKVIFAWGKLPFLRGQYADHVLRLMELARLLRTELELPPPMALHVNNDGSPGHPLYLPYGRTPVAFMAP